MLYLVFLPRFLISISAANKMLTFWHLHQISQVIRQNCIKMSLSGHFKTPRCTAWSCHVILCGQQWSLHILFTLKKKKKEKNLEPSKSCGAKWKCPSIDIHSSPHISTNYCPYKNSTSLEVKFEFWRKHLHVKQESSDTSKRTDRCYQIFYPKSFAVSNQWHFLQADQVLTWGAIWSQVWNVLK